MEKKKRNLNFRFHNPNAAGVMEKMAERLLVQNGVERLHAEFLNAACECAGEERRRVP